MRFRSLVDLEQDIVLRFSVPDKSRKHIKRALREAQLNGIRMASAVASDYDHLSAHPYLVSECILGKLNSMRGKPSKNGYAKKLDNALRSLELKVDGLEGTMRFLVRSQRLNKAQKR